MNNKEMKPEKSTVKVAEAIEAFLRSDGWRYSVEDDRSEIQFGLRLKGKIKKCDYVVDIRNDECIVYAILPVSADCDDSKMMTGMADFVCRANYGLKNGNFEFDMRDGELRYKSYIDCEDHVPSQGAVRNSIYCSALMIDRYSPGFIDIIFNEIRDTETLIEQCEGNRLKELYRRLESAKVAQENGADDSQSRCADMDELGDEAQLEYQENEKPKINIELFEE